MSDDFFVRAVFWLGIVGLIWLVLQAIFVPVQVRA
jgi:hypothetical protein